MLQKILEPFTGVWRHRVLVKQFTIRDVNLRYKGSFLGIVWSFITPILMLIVYTFVFSEIFEAKWDVGSDNKIEFALIVFCGLAVYNLFAETMTRSPGLILSNVNYVKKVVFPLEILPLSVMLSAFINLLISFIVLFAGILVFHEFHYTSLLFIVVLLPYILFVAGLSWIFSALGVYLRDVGQVIVVVVQALMLLSPIFYPVTAFPEDLQLLYHLNPIGIVIEEMRRVVIFGQLPNWNFVLGELVFSLLVYMIGYKCFKKAKKGFADVV